MPVSNLPIEAISQEDYDSLFAGTTNFAPALVHENSFLIVRSSAPGQPETLGYFRFRDGDGFRFISVPMTPALYAKVSSAKTQEILVDTVKALSLEVATTEDAFVCAGKGV